MFGWKAKKPSKKIKKNLVPDSMHPVIQDIVPEDQEKTLSLQKHRTIIEVDLDNFHVGEILRKHRRHFFIGGFFIFALIFSISAYRIHAEISKVDFYASSCLGGWQNTRQAEDAPDVKNGDFSFTKDNSAFAGDSDLSIFCGGFTGDIPESVTPKKFLVKFSWLIASNTSGAPDTTPSSPSPDTNNSDSTPDTSVPDSTPPSPDTTPPVEILPAPDETPAPSGDNTPPVEDATPSPAPVEDTPVSFFEKNFIAVAHADDAPAPDIKDGSDAISLPQDDFLEVKYTIDGETWKSLGKVNASNWENAELELSDSDISKWADLSKLQISLQTLSTPDASPAIYLDSVYIEAEYENVEALINPPKIVIKDPSVIFSGKQDFASAENPTFVISDPELTISDINTLVKDDKAEVVEDRNAVLEETQNTEAAALNTPADIPTSEILDPLKKIVDPIINTTEKDTQKAVDAVTSFLKPKTVLASASGTIIDAKVLDLNGEETSITTSIDTVTELGIEKQKITVHKPSRDFHPGAYKLKISLQTPQAIIISEQDFNWGVLSININKSIYQAGNDAYIQMGVLNENGHTLCDADLDLQITSPTGASIYFSTSDDSIVREPACGPDNVISVPDYYAHFTIPDETGMYQMILVAQTQNGSKTISDSFEVKESSDFTIERTGPTRIYPVSAYPVTLHVTSAANWQGTLTETVPSSFEISPSETGIEYDSVVTNEDDNTKIISWNVSLTAGEEQTFGYNFDAPDISPEFYLIGPATLTDANADVSFKEARSWQIASDAACNATASGTWGGGSDTASFTSCTGSAANGTGTGNRPASGDTLTINAGVALTLAGNVQVAGITIAAQASSNSPLTMSTFTLTNTGTLVCTVPSANNTTSTIAVGAGTLANTGLITLNAAATAKVCSITISTGTITMGGGITFSGATPVFNNTGAGTINLSGTMSAGGTVTINSGTTTHTTNTTAINGAYTFGIVSVDSGTTTLGAAETFAGNLSIATNSILKLGAFAFTESGTSNITGAINCPAAASCTGLKTFTGAMTVNSGGSFDLNTGTPTVAPTTSFANNITVSTGATSFNTGIATSTTVFTANSTLSGAVSMTFAGGLTTINSGVTLTNSNTGTVTFAALTIASPTASNGMSLTTGSTTTVTGALTFTANAAANNETITMNGTANLNAGSLVTSASTSTGLVTIVGAASASGTLAVSGTTTLVGSSVASSTGAIIDFATNTTTCGFTTVALTETAGTISPAKVLMGTGTFTSSGLVTLTGAASGTALAQLLSTTTGTLNIGAGLTMAGTVIANATLTAGSGGIVKLTGTMSGLGTLSIASATFKTTGTSAIGAAYTLPNLTVLAGTTTLQSFAIIISGTTTINSTGILTNLTGATLKTFIGLVTVNSGGSFSLNVATACTVEFRGGIQVDSGATAFATTGATTFSTASQSISGGGTIALAFGATTVNANILLTNSYTGNTVTFATLTLAAPTSASDGLSLATGTTTTSTGLISFGANAAAGAFTELITLNGTATLTAGSVTLSAPTSVTSGAKEGIIAASGASGLVSIGATTLTCTGVGTQFCGIDLSAGTNALTVTTLSASGSATDAAQVLMSSGTFTSSGLVTLTASSLNPSAVFTRTTGTMTLGAGLTFAGTPANAQLNTGASTITLTGTMSGLGTLSIASATFNTTGTSAIGAAYTLPNLTVLAGTTTLQSFAIIISGTTTINSTGILTNLTGATLKTFIGLVTVNSGGSFSLNVATACTVEFRGGIQVDSGATAFATTGATTFSTASQSISGGGTIALAFGATTVNANILLTNSYTGNTVTFATLTLAAPTSASDGLSLATGTTTTSTGLISFTANAGTGRNQTITMNGTANLNAGSFTMNGPTSTGNASVSCAAGSGTLTVTGALGITASTGTGSSTLAMDTCTLTANGLVTITGGSVGVASISASTGTVNINAGITFAVTLAQARITTSDAATINFTGTMTGVGILSGINSATTINTKGTVTVNAGITFPNLTVFSGTTTLGAAATVTNALNVSSGALLKFAGFAFTVSGSTTVDGSITCTAAATCTGLKTFTGAVDVNSGGIINLTGATVLPTTSFAGGITMDGTTFNTDTSTTTFTANQSLSGGVNITLGAVIINSGVTLTNGNSATVTMATLTMPIATSANNLSLSAGSTTTVTGLISFTANTQANAQTITMNDDANLNAGTLTINAPTSTGGSKITCASGASGTFTVTGALSMTGNSTTTGPVTLGMLTCDLVANGAVAINGGTNATGKAMISASTATLDFNSGVTFGGTAANGNLTTTGAAAVFLTGTMSGAGTLSLNSATSLETVGTAAFNTAYTLTNLTVFSGTTTLGAIEIVSNGLTVSSSSFLSLGAFALTSSSTTDVDGSITCPATCTGLKTFTGAVTVYSGGIFDLTAATVAPTSSFNGGITMAGTTWNTGTGTTLFTASQIIDGGSAMIFGGATTINNTFTLTNNNTSTVDFNSSIVGSGSTGNFATGSGSTTRFATTVMSTGTLTPSTSSNTIEYDGGTQTIKAPSTHPYYNLSITASGVKSLAATTTVSGAINISAGTLDTTSGSSYTVNTHDMTIGASGTFLANNSAVGVTGDWSNSGLFTAGGSTVTLSGTGQQTLSGTMTSTSSFYNLTITNNSGTNASDGELTSFVPGVIFGDPATSTHNYVITTASVRVQYESGSTYTFANINWNGQASGTKIYFRNSATSGTWLLNVSGTQTAVSYVNASRSDATAGSDIVASDGTNIDSGNNTAWTFAQIISVTLSSDGTVTYGTLAASATANTTSGGLNDTQVAENDGNGSESFNIKGQNTSCPWTLASSSGAEQYKHEFSVNSGSVWTPLTTSYQTLGSGIAVSGTKSFDLKITMPSSSSCATSQSVNVTLQAVAP